MSHPLLDSCWMTQEAIEKIPMKQFQYWAKGFVDGSPMIIKVHHVIHDSWDVSLCKVFIQEGEEL